MAKVLSDDFYIRTRNSVRFTESAQGRKSLQSNRAPRRHAAGLLWAKLTDDGADIGFDRRAYVGDIYLCIGDATPIASEVFILNAWEWTNTSGVRAGYEIVSAGSADCGDIIGIEPLPVNVWFPVIDNSHEAVGGDGETYCYIIKERNDPKFKED